MCGQLGVTPVSVGLGVQVSSTYLLCITCPITISKSTTSDDANGPSGLVSSNCTEQEGGNKLGLPRFPPLPCSLNVSAALQMDVHPFLRPQFLLSSFKDQD